MKPASTPSDNWRVEYLVNGEWVSASFGVSLFHEQSNRERAQFFFESMSGPDWTGVQILRLYRGDELMIERTKHNFTE